MQAREVPTMLFLDLADINWLVDRSNDRNGGEWAMYRLVDTCLWTINLDGFWSTQCGNAFEFNDGGPSDNGAKFCPYCGGEIEQEASE